MFNSGFSITEDGSIICSRPRTAVARMRSTPYSIKWIAIDPGVDVDDYHSINEMLRFIIVTPNSLVTLSIGGLYLRDDTGFLVARFIASSQTVTDVELYENRFGDATFFAVASALRFNTSLRYLNMRANEPDNKYQIEEAFIEALRINPDRPARSNWWLFDWGVRDCDRLRHEAKQLGHPTMQQVLATILDREVIGVKINK